MSNEISREISDPAASNRVLSEQFAREVAGAVAEGFTSDRILSQLDLSPLELEEIFESERFLIELERHGPTVVTAWREARSTERASGVRERLADNLDRYYHELNELATSNQLKPEKRADILLALAKHIAPPDERTAPVVRMPPSLIENWARRHAAHEARLRERTRANNSTTGSAG